MSTSVIPTKNVRCVYTTVLSSKATRYYAVAPVATYAKKLSTQLANDVDALVTAHTSAANAACCIALTTGTTSSSSASSTSSSLSSCVCLVNTTVLEVNRRFVDQPSLLGLTFEVNFAVYVYKDGVVEKAAAAADGAATSNPSLPFVWSVDRHSAFPNIVQNLFHALTRKVYLSELTTSPDVFAHVTIEEVELMVHSSYDIEDDDDDDDVVDVKAEGKTEAIRATQPNKTALQPSAAARRMASPLPLRVNVLGSTSDVTEVDYCTLLRGTLSSAYTTKPTMATFQAASLTDKDSTTSYTYPVQVVNAGLSYNEFTYSQCHGAMCSLGTVCGVLIIILILAAGVAFVVRYCRRRRSEQKDEKRLLQRQLR